MVIENDRPVLERISDLKGSLVIVYGSYLGKPPERGNYGQMLSEVRRYAERNGDLAVLEECSELVRLAEDLS